VKCIRSAATLLAAIAALKLLLHLYAARHYGYFGLGVAPAVALCRRRILERAAGPCRPPLLTHVCKRGGRPPSAFRLLPCGQAARSLHTSA
jgi:hypothetical protein